MELLENDVKINVRIKLFFCLSIYTLFCVTTYIMKAITKDFGTKYGRILSLAYLSHHSK